MLPEREEDGFPEVNIYELGVDDRCTSDSESNLQLYEEDYLDRMLIYKVNLHVCPIEACLVISDTLFFHIENLYSGIADESTEDFSELPKCSR